MIRQVQDIEDAAPAVAKVVPVGKFLEPGVYPGIPMDDYLAMPAVSASILKVLLSDCPRAAWWDSWLNPNRPADKPTKIMGVGTIAHGILLEGSTKSVAVIDPNDYPTEKTGNIPTGWTNKGIKAARDAAISNGKIPIFPAKMQEIEAMVDAAYAYIESLKQTEPAVWATFQPDGGDSELTMTWLDSKTPCRIRHDRISSNRKTSINYKTGGTSSEPNQWGRTQMIRMGYYVSEAFYQRGVKACCDVTSNHYFLTQEDWAPYLCSLVRVGDMHFEIGHAKIAQALSTWQSCVDSGTWPGYPSHAVVPEAPAWLLNEALESGALDGVSWRERIDPMQDEHGLQA